jgi:hypothetical protein
LWTVALREAWAAVMISVKPEVMRRRLLVGFVLWPFVAIGIQQSTGSFARAFLIVPVAMLLMELGIRLFTPEHKGKELDAIAI